MYRPGGILGDIDGDSGANNLDIPEVYKKLFSRAGIPYELNGEGRASWRMRAKADHNARIPPVGTCMGGRPRLAIRKSWSDPK